MAGTIFVESVCPLQSEGGEHGEFVGGERGPPGIAVRAGRQPESYLPLLLGEQAALPPCAHASSPVPALPRGVTAHEGADALRLWRRLSRGLRTSIRSARSSLSVPWLSVVSEGVNRHEDGPADLFRGGQVVRCQGGLIEQGVSRRSGSQGAASASR